MTSFGSITPKVVRGGIVARDPSDGHLLGVIPFQYNPDTLTRTLQTQGIADEPGDRLEALRLKGPPHETIRLDAEFDTTDELEQPDANANNQIASELGLHPILASIEMLITPPVAQLNDENTKAGLGIIEIAQVQAPLTLLVLGRNRVVPVRLTDLSVTEDAFDTELNPMRAKVSITARVITVDDLGFGNIGGNTYLAYQGNKESYQSQAPKFGISTVGLNSLPGG